MAADSPNRSKPPRSPPLVVVVDGASPSAGVTLEQAAELMVRVHAEMALNLDGGGSTAMAIAQPGGGFRMVNRPSDSTSASCTVALPSGCERYVGAILAVRAPWPSAESSSAEASRTPTRVGH